MADAFDPYYKWLSIPPEEQPPHFYRLLGVKTFEADADVLENAADQRMSHLRSFQTGKHAAESQKLLNELAAARLCLLSPDKRQAYDRELKTKLAAEKPATAPARAEAPASPAPVAKSLAVARPITAKPVAQATEPATALGFDPLEQTPARRPKKRGSNQSPAIYAGIGLGLIAVVAIAWIAVGGSGSSEDRHIAAHDAKAPSKAKDAGSADDDNTSPFRAVPKPSTSSHSTNPAPDDPGPAPTQTDSDAPDDDPADPDEPVGDMADEMPVAESDADDGATTDPATDDRPQPPNADQVATAVVEVQRVLHDDYTAAKKSADKTALAEKLLALVPDSSGASEQYALLSEARRLAIAASNPALALQAADRLAESFAVDRFEQLAKTAEELAAREPSPAARKELVEAIEPLVDAALAAGQFAPGRRLAAVGLAAARKTNQTDIAKTFVRQSKEMAAGEKLAAGAADARARLAENPDDPKANETLGKYLCLYVHDWPAALPHLAKGSDEKLKSLAQQELRAPTDAEQQIQLADGWWDLGQSSKPPEKQPMLLHAASSYEQALPGVDSKLVKTKLQKRLDEASKAGEAVPLAPGRSPPLAKAPFNEKTAKQHQTRWAKYLRVPVVRTNSIGMKLVLIPPGEFDMGSPEELIEQELKAHGDDNWYKDHLPGEGPRHHVRITQPFYLGMCLVTQGEYERVMGTNPSEFSATGKGNGKVAGQDTSQFPVEMVSWDDSVELCRRLSDSPAEKAAGRRYLLPTEAQWEYACRAGSMGRFGFSPSNGKIPKEDDENALADYGWFGKNSGGFTHAVGGRRANAWGLYDMHGNVWEWCHDWYDSGYYATSRADDPSGPSGGARRVDRGGGWPYRAGLCRSAYRNSDAPGSRYGLLGFRVSVAPSESADAKPQSPAEGSNSPTSLKFTKWSYPADEHGQTGYFEQRGAEWVEAKNEKVVAHFQESARTADYVELYDAGRELWVRLKPSEYTFSRDQTNWHFLARGAPNVKP